MAAKTMTLLLIGLLVSAIVALVAEAAGRPPLPAEWTTAKKLKAALDAKTREAFDGVEAAAPPATEQKAEAHRAGSEQQFLIDIALAKATASGDESNYVSVAAAYEKAADAVIAAAPPDKLTTMGSAFAAVAAPNPGKCPAIDKPFCETNLKMNKAVREVMATAGGDTPPKKQLKQRLVADAVINKAYADGDRKRIVDILAAYGKAADAVVAAAPPEKLRVMEETFMAVAAHPPAAA